MGSRYNSITEMLRVWGPLSCGRSDWADRILGRASIVQWWGLEMGKLRGFPSTSLL